MLVNFSMKFPQKIRSNRLFFRILFYFLTLLIPILLITGIFYMNFMEVLQRDYAEKIASNLESSAGTIDLYLRSAHETSLNLLSHSTLQKYFRPEAEQTLKEKVERAEITRVVSRANHMVSDYSDVMFLYNDGSKVYLSDGVADFQLFFNKFYPLRSYSGDFWSSQLHDLRSFKILPPTFAAASGKDVICFLTKGIVSGYDTIAVITLPLDVFKNTFMDHFIFPETDFVILNKNNEVILNSNPDLLTIERLSSLDSKFQETGSKQLRTGLFPAKSIATYSESDRYGWKYYSVTPLGAINENISGFFTFIVLVSTLMLGVGVMFSFLFSIKIYNPIRQIRDILEEKNDGPEERNSKNEFEFIGSGIKQLYESSSLFRNKFEQVSMEYLDHSILNILRGGSLEQERTIQGILRNELDFGSDSYLCCNIQFDFHEDFYRQIQDVDRFIILSKLKKVVSGLIREYVTGHVIEYKQSLYVCLINIMKDEEKSALMNALNNIIKTFGYDFNYCKISIGIGGACFGLANLPNSFNEAMTALQTRTGEEQFQIIDSQQLSIQHNFYYSFVEENKVANWLKTGEMEQLEQDVRAIVQANRERGVSHQYIQMLFSEMFNTGCKYAAEKGLDIQQFISGKSQAQLRGHADLAGKDERKIEILLEFYSKLTEHISRVDKKTLPLVSVVIKYVEENYGKDLYLEKISEEFGVSSKYISRIFKEKTGTNLTDYISLVRITKAKQLLVESDLQISKIGERIGIYNRTTFLRTFKKLEGVSPAEYRTASK